MQGVWIVLYRQHIAVEGISFRSSLKFITNNEHILIGNVSKGEGNQCFVLYRYFLLFSIYYGALPFGINGFHAESNIITDIDIVYLGVYNIYKKTVREMDTITFPNAGSGNIKK